MRFLKGGMVLLNLTAITLGLTSGETSITNEGILKELTELRNFIDANEDFSGKSKGLKPVILEYRSSASEFHGIAQGSLSFHTDALHMSIGANVMQADGTSLAIIINVVYEWTDYIGYTVKTATINATKNVRSFEDIVDKDGHKRFIEGEGEAQTTIEGFAITYNKWSLSGSHLMIVLAGTFEASTEIPSGNPVLSRYYLPKWVYDKIVGTIPPYIEFKSTPLTASGYGLDDTLPVTLLKYDDNSLLISCTSKTTANLDTAFRVEFDLIIDNEETPAP